MRSPFGRPRPPSRSTVSRWARVTFASMMHRCGREIHRSGGTEGDIQNRRTGGLDAHLDAGLVADHRRQFPAPMRVKLGRGGRDGGGHALPTCATATVRRAGHAGSGRRPARLSGAAGGVAIVFRPHSVAPLSRRAQGLPGILRSLPTVKWVRCRPETHSGPILSSVRARPDPCSRRR
jgi:hypothetical protein